MNKSKRIEENPKEYGKIRVKTKKSKRREGNLREYGKLPRIPRESDRIIKNRENLKESEKNQKGKKQKYSN